MYEYPFAMKVSAIDTHELVLEVNFWTCSLAPMTLEVVTIAKVEVISEKFTVPADKPLSVIEEANTIPGEEVLEPPSNVMADVFH